MHWTNLPSGLPPRATNERACLACVMCAQVGENLGPEAAGMRIKLIDTVGLEDAESGDAVNLQVRSLEIQ